MSSGEWHFLKDIGATKSIKKLVPANFIELTKKLTAGKLMTAEELLKLESTWVKKAPYLDAEGNPFVLFIPDRSFSEYGWGDRLRKSFAIGEVTKSNYKYHFMNCSTQMSMHANQRGARYKAKYDVEDPFFPRAGEDRGQDILDVCKNCLNEYDFDDFHGHKSPTVEEFNIKSFFDSCNGAYPEVFQPSHQGYNMAYTKDWDEISRKYKAEKGWTCETCNKDLSNNKSLLHSHHIDGVKDNNKPSNLKALCNSCHSEEPQHGHLKRRHT